MQLVLGELNHAADVWFQFVYHSTWQASLLAGIMLAVVAVGRRWPSPIRYWLLMLALCKFALPPMLSLPTGFFSQMGPTVQLGGNQVIASQNLPSYAGESHPPVSPMLTSPRSNPSEANVNLSVDETHVASTLEGVSAYACLMLLHGLGTLVVACWILCSLYAVRRTLRRANGVVDEAIARRFEALSKRLGLRKPPRLVLSPQPCGPAAFGVIRPIVVLPDSAKSLDLATQDAVLAHELTHHRRRDPCMNWIQLFLTATWWFNPLIWILNRQIRKVREDCCDDFLLTYHMATGRAYCDMLMSAASQLGQRKTPSATLGFADRLHPLGRRFQRILDQTTRKAARLSHTSCGILVILAAVLLPGLRRSVGDDLTKAAPPAETAPQTAPSNADDTAPRESEWPEGATVTGRVIDHLGQPIADVDVVMLGADERIALAPQSGTWRAKPANRDAAAGATFQKPPSTRTDAEGMFALTRNQGAAERLLVIGPQPVFVDVLRSSLTKADNVEIEIPEAGSLAVTCDFPKKAGDLEGEIELTRARTGKVKDYVPFETLQFPLGERATLVFSQLPPGHYDVQCYKRIQRGPRSILHTCVGQQIVEVTSTKRTSIGFERREGSSVSGVVRVLEDVKFDYANLTISPLDSKQVAEHLRKFRRTYSFSDVISIEADGRFTTDPLPPGKYTAHVRVAVWPFARQVPPWEGKSTFTVPENGDVPDLEIIAKPDEP